MEVKATSAKKVRIEIKLGDPDNPELHIIGQADEEIVDQTLKFFGLRYKPPEPVKLSPTSTVSCISRMDCIDYPNKCQDCESNKAKSLFVPKSTS